MSHTLFIADLHLDKRYPQALSAFVDYIDHLENQNVDALYILGDLFEYWLGDDCVDNTAKMVAKTLAHYHEKTQTPLYFIHGNRDFLLGEDYAQTCCLNILPEHTVINLYGVQTLILHGDTLCTDDIAYMRFREQAHQPEWQKKVLNLPQWARRLKALHMRYRSKQANKKKDDAIMDVAPKTVEKMVQKYQVRQIIHGHTHRPNTHHFDVNGSTVTRHVVGDWYTQGSVLSVDANAAKLTALPFSKHT